MIIDDTEPEDIFTGSVLHSRFGKLIALKKQILGYSLFLTLLAPVLITFSYLHTQKYLLRKEVKQQIIAGIDKNDLVLLAFSAEQAQTELRWKHAREFEYRGEMYDIVEHEQSGDSLFYWCWWDSEETQLNRQLEELLTQALQQNHQRQQRQHQLLSFFKNLFHHSEQHFLHIPPASPALHFVEMKEQLAELHLTPSCPPPNFS